ncbi:MAG: thioredoxin family protein [Bacteroidota bacterium]|nr:thioredoxin family protein [Bacteroidota bacterium]
MKKRFYFISLFFLLSCGNNVNQKPLNIKHGKTIDGKVILLGKINRANLEQSEHVEWFKKEYDYYKLSDQWVESVKNLFGDISLKLFMGTWCEDSEREVPAMFKILDAVNFDENKIEIYAMSEEKTTPENFENGLNIIKVPTLIFYKNGEELNRFVEFPIVSLEEDIRKILSGEEYRDAYYSE